MIDISAEKPMQVINSYFEGLVVEDYKKRDMIEGK